MFLSPPTRKASRKADSKDQFEQKLSWNEAAGRSASSMLGSPRLRLKRRALPNWHEEIKKASETRNWEDVRSSIGHVQQLAGVLDSSGKGEGELGNSKSSLGSFFSSENSQQSIGNRLNDSTVKRNFWTRLVKGRSARNHDGFGLLGTDDDSRTPLHLILKLCRDQSVVLNIINLEPGAASMATSKGRLPLHFAVVHRHDWPIIAALIDAYPAGLSMLDSKGNTPLRYAMNISVRESMKTIPPRTYWMPIVGGDDGEYLDEDPVVEEVALWQEEQIERWATVHWLLLSSATHPQSNLSVEGGQRPMLVEALLCAAPPPVISLLIGASVMNLPIENKVTAFAASTLYSCITRQYPLSILQSLANQLHVLVRGSSNKIDMRAVRDETGMGLVSAQYISCCFVQPQHGHNQDWMLSEEFYDALSECISAGRIIDDNPALLDWWDKMEFLISFCWVSSTTCYNRSRRKKKAPAGDENLDPSSHPKHQLLHAALANNDTPPMVVQLLLSFYPRSLSQPDKRSGALPLHIACMNTEYVPRYFEQESALFSVGPALSTLELILQADPSAAKKRFQGRTALHLAIASGKNFDAIPRLLISGDGRQHDIQSGLGCRDPKTFLYPFQLAAAYSNKTDSDSFRWTCVARNKFSHAVWQGKSDREKASEILKVAEGEELSRTDTIFQLLRRFPGVVRPCQLEVQKRSPVVLASKKKVPTEEERESLAPANTGILPYLKDYVAKDARHPVDSSSTTDDSSFVEASKVPRSPSKKVAPTSLTLLLSKGRKLSRKNEAFFDCDASVFSNVDVLSTLTSTLHTYRKDGKDACNAEEQSISILSVDSEDESDTDDSSSFDGFAEESGLRSISDDDAFYGDGDRSLKPNKNDDETMETSSIESSVCFEIRRKPRKPCKSSCDVKEPSRANHSKETPALLRAAYLQKDEENGDAFHQSQVTETEDSLTKTEKDESISLSEMKCKPPEDKSMEPSDAENKVETGQRQETLLGSFTAGSESEGLTFDAIHEATASATSSVSIESPPTMAGKACEVHPKTFDKVQMRWVRLAPETANQRQQLRHCQAQQTKLCRSQEGSGKQHPNLFIGRPPRLRKSALTTKKVPTRQLNSCMLCGQGALEVLMIPCKHLCICRRCSIQRASIQQCPVCSSAVIDRMILLS